MKPHHTILLSNFFVFLVGMVLGAALAHNPLLWIVVIILVALALALMGASTMKPRKKRLPRKPVR